MKLSIFGGSGGVGSKCVVEACNSTQIKSIKVLTRKKTKLMDAVGDSWDESKCTCVEGDVTDEAVVKRMCEDVDIVLSCLGNTGGPVIVERAVRSILETLKGGSTKFIFLTSIGVGDSLSQGKKMAPLFAYVIKPCFLHKVFQDLEEAEEAAFSQSSTSVIACRPPGLRDSPCTGKVALKPASDLTPSTSASISRHDVAKGMLKVCTNSQLWTEWEGKGVTIVMDTDKD